MSLLPPSSEGFSQPRPLGQDSGTEAAGSEPFWRAEPLPVWLGSPSMQVPIEPSLIQPLTVPVWWQHLFLRKLPIVPSWDKSSRHRFLLRSCVACCSVDTETSEVSGTPSKTCFSSSLARSQFANGQQRPPRSCLADFYTRASFFSSCSGFGEGARLPKELKRFFWNHPVGPSPRGAS